MHLSHLVADDPDLTLTRAGARGLTASVRVPVQSWGMSRHEFRVGLQTLAAGSVRRRTAVERASRVIAEAQGDYKGLRLPGRAAVRHAWHPRLDVVLLEDELRIAGNGLLARFAVADMVLVSYGTSPRGALRVDLLDGEHVCVSLRDQGQFMERLRHRLWEYEKSFLGDASDIDWVLDVSPAMLAEAEAAMDAAEARLQASGRSLAQDRIAQDLVTRSTELRRRARVDAFRRRRLRMRSRVGA